MFQFHKVQLTHLSHVNFSDIILFQFHKVQLTRLLKVKRAILLFQFQFHKVQLTPDGDGGPLLTYSVSIP